MQKWTNGYKGYTCSGYQIYSVFHGVIGKAVTFVTSLFLGQKEGKSYKKKMADFYGEQHE